MKTNGENQEVRSDQELTSCDAESIEELQKKCEEYRNRAEENKKKGEEYLKNLKLLKAEFENYRKRETQYRENFTKMANKELILKLLPVMDDMDKAIWESKKNDVHESFLEGAELIYRKLLNILEKEGVRQVQAIGEKFDPKYHEAVMAIASPDYEDYAIVEEFRKGYILNDEVIRATQVSVNRWDKNGEQK